MSAAAKKPKKPRLPHERGPGKKVLIAILVVVACAGILALFWFFSRLGPRDVEYQPDAEPRELSEEVRELREESRRLEAEYEEVLAMREPGPEDLALLREARRLQRRFVEALPTYDAEADERLENLDKRYQDAAAERLKEESLRLAEEAETLAGEDDYEAASAKFEEAFKRQRRINENYPRSEAHNPGRAARLQRQGRFLKAEPLLRESKRLAAEATRLAEQGKWDEAAEVLQRSIDIQDRLNSDFRGTNQASVARLEELKVRLVGYQSGRAHREIERVAAMADERRAEGENLEAASLYREAARLQRELNREYPESPHASSERVAEYQRKSQTAESYELGLEIEANHERLKRLLAGRRTYEAAEVVVDLRRDIQQMSENFPRSSLNDENLQVKIRYLNLVQNDIGFIQDRVYGALLPIPGIGDWRMLRTEVPQALYSLIMGANPSRNQGDTLPVDSVSWNESKDFCERLSWILGKRVRLPTENEFREALGRLRYVVLEKHVWSVADSGGEARPVGKKEPFSSGFYDLLGNVSEWLESVDRLEGENVLHIGGHAQDRLEAIFTVPVRESAPGERNRMTGFRFVVRAE